jgi:hypothetical protein
MDRNSAESNSRTYAIDRYVTSADIGDVAVELRTCIGIHVAQELDPALRSRFLNAGYRECPPTWLTDSKKHRGIIAFELLPRNINADLHTTLKRDTKRAQPIESNVENTVWKTIPWDSVP